MVNTVQIPVILDPFSLFWASTVPFLLPFRLFWAVPYRSSYRSVPFRTAPLYRKTKTAAAYCPTVWFA